MTSGPLQGIRVADFSWAWAGPYATMLLAMAGAEVIRIETLGRLDFIRAGGSRARAGGAAPSEEVTVNLSPSFNTMNLNKKAVQLDLNQPEAVHLAKELVRISDVVLENYRPGAMDKFGLGYEELRKIRPDIVMISVSGMGQVGPERGYSALAVNFGALSGMSYLTSYPDGIPTEMRGPMDLLTGTTACFATLAALRHRRRTGEGQYVDLAAREAITTLLGDLLMDYALNERPLEPMGNRHPSLAPHGVYPCSEEDSWITIAVGNDAEWRALCTVMGRPELTDDTRFSDALSRWHHQEELDELIGAWTQGCRDIDLMRRLQAGGVAAAPSFSNKEFWEDEHLRQRGVYAEVTHPEMGHQVVMGPPFRLPATPLEITAPGPLMGQHTREVFCGLLGLSEQEFDRLSAQKVFY